MPLTAIGVATSVPPGEEEERRGRLGEGGRAIVEPKDGRPGQGCFLASVGQGSAVGRSVKGAQDLTDIAAVTGQGELEELCRPRGCREAIRERGDHGA